MLQAYQSDNSVQGYQVSSDQRIWFLMKMLLNSPKAAYTKQVYNIVSQRAILPPRVLLIFVSLFIEGIWTWKLNSYKFYCNFYNKTHLKREKPFLFILLWLPLLGVWRNSLYIIIISSVSGIMDTE